MALEYVEGDTLVITADLPGLDPGRDLEVFIVADVLHIRARHERPAARDYGSDLRFGTFVRDIALPAGTAEGDVRASYRDGRLVVRAPHGPASELTRIAVPIEGASDAFA